MRILFGEIKDLQGIDTAIRKRVNLSDGFRIFFDSTKGARNRNEDNYLVINGNQDQPAAQWLSRGKRANRVLQKWPYDFARIAIADGMGGHAGGQEISQAAIESLLDISPALTIDEMHRLVLELHFVLLEQFSTHEDKSPGTTLIVLDLCLSTGKGVLAHIGDSRAYLLTTDQIKPLTKDHTGEEFDYREGDISYGQYEQQLHQNRNDLAQALGNGSFGLLRNEGGYRPGRYSRQIRLDRRKDLRPDLATHADVMEIRLGRGKAVMLATDGLWNASEAGAWHGPLSGDFLSEMEIGAQINKALNDGSTDNITAVIFGYSGA